MYKISEDYLRDVVNNKEPIDLWLNSFGGCRSNYIRSILEQKYRLYNYAYEYKMCHYIKPIKDLNIDTCVYCVVSDVGLSITSQINRAVQNNFYKLLPYDEELDFSIINWLNLIKRQIDNFSNFSKEKYGYDLIIINTDHLIHDQTKEKFQDVFGLNIDNYVPRKTTKWDDRLIPHSNQIEIINNKIKKLRYIDV